MGPFGSDSKKAGFGIVSKEDIKTRLADLVQPYLAAQGVELVEVQFTQPPRGGRPCACSWTGKGASPWVKLPR